MSRPQNHEVQQQQNHYPQKTENNKKELNMFYKSKEPQTQLADNRQQVSQDINSTGRGINRYMNNASQNMTNMTQFHQRKFSQNEISQSKSGYFGNQMNSKQNLKFQGQVNLNQQKYQREQDSRRKKQIRVQIIANKLQKILRDLEQTQNLDCVTLFDCIDESANIDQEFKILWERLGEISGIYIQLYFDIIQRQYEEFQYKCQEMSNDNAYLAESLESERAKTSALEEQIRQLKHTVQKEKEGGSNSYKRMNSSSCNNEIQVLREEKNRLNLILRQNKIKEQKMFNLIQELMGVDQQIAENDLQQFGQQFGVQEQEVQEMVSPDHAYIKSFKKLSNSVTKSAKLDISRDIPCQNLFSQFQKAKQFDLLKQQQINPEECEGTQKKAIGDTPVTMKIKRDLKLLSNKLGVNKPQVKSVISSLPGSPARLLELDKENQNCQEAINAIQELTLSLKNSNLLRNSFKDQN